MSPALTDVLVAVKSLSGADRRELVELLLDGLDGADDTEATPILTAAWQQEVDRRSDELDAGRAETFAWEEVKTRWQSRKATDG